MVMGSFVPTNFFIVYILCIYIVIYLGNPVIAPMVEVHNSSFYHQLPSKSYICVLDFYLYIYLLTYLI